MRATISRTGLCFECSRRVERCRCLDADDLAGEPDPVGPEADAIRGRIMRVRLAKLLNLRFGGFGELSLDELDAVLPPVPCRRTRDRLARGA